MDVTKCTPGLYILGKCGHKTWPHFFGLCTMDFASAASPQKYPENLGSGSNDSLKFITLTLFRSGGYKIDTCLPFSLYLWHGFRSESEQPNRNRVKKIHSFLILTKIPKLSHLFAYFLDYFASWTKNRPNLTSLNTKNFEFELLPTTTKTE